MIKNLIDSESLNFSNKHYDRQIFNFADFKNTTVPCKK